MHKILNLSKKIYKNLIENKNESLDSLSKNEKLILKKINTVLNKKFYEKNVEPTVNRQMLNAKFYIIKIFRTLFNPLNIKVNSNSLDKKVDLELIGILKNKIKIINTSQIKTKLGTSKIIKYSQFKQLSKKYKHVNKIVIDISAWEIDQKLEQIKYLKNNSIEDNEKFIFITEKINFDDFMTHIIIPIMDNMLQ